jgi:5'-nucleotidase
MALQPLILVTNDDGIGSPGLHAAVAAVADLGEVLVVAPHTQQTGMGRAVPPGTLVGVIEEYPLVVDGISYKAYSVHGSPAQAVLHGLFELASRKPGLCISGINYGENLGASLTRSGTVGAALEAASNGIPAIATSFEVDTAYHHATSYATVDWEIAVHFTHLLAKNVLSHGLPSGVDLLNISIPATATPTTQMRLTRQSHQNYFEERKPPTRDYAQPYRFYAQISFDKAYLEPDSDIYAFAVDRVVSVSPLTLNLTPKNWLPQWRNILLENKA